MIIDSRRVLAATLLWWRWTLVGSFQPCIQPTDGVNQLFPVNNHHDPEVALLASTEDVLDDDKDLLSATADRTSDCCNRRCFVSAVRAAVVTSGFLLPFPSVQAIPTTDDLLCNTRLGSGKWVSRSTPAVRSGSAPLELSPTFVTYCTRFLIQFDEQVNFWWRDLETSLALMSSDTKQQEMGRAFGTFAKSLQTALEERKSTASLFHEFSTQYGDLGPDVVRHMGLLFALLPPEQQPVSSLEKYYDSPARVMSPPPSTTASRSTTTRLYGDNLTQLLTQEFHIVKTQHSFSIEPRLALYQVGIGNTEYATYFGPLAATPLARDTPVYTFSTYSLLGLAGASGCALTHATVIPLDVVKTRAQTDGTSKGWKSIVQTQGFSGLFLGAQATIAGYLWYGVSVYPCYTLFKRWLGRAVLPVDVAVAHTNEVALVAGALASVVASVGLTPLEAARIRVVANPDAYRALGVGGTLRSIASEGASSGIASLYAGLPSLLTRQVIFGSIKFLAFERACETIFAMAPVLRDATWTSLGVSLAAGAFSGVLSSVVSQPADSLLTYVAKGDREMGLWEGAQSMVGEDGPGALFRGLSSRCVWAGSIIAGQFFLYDIFRTSFGVSADDLSQVLVLQLSNQG